MVSLKPATTALQKISSPDGRVEALVEACLGFVEYMNPRERESFLKKINERLRPILVPKAGDVLGVVVQLIPKDREWSVKEIKKMIDQAGSVISDKEIYNAVGYLTRKSHIVRVGQGRYIINGMAVVSADEFGAHPTITGGDLDDQEK